MGGLARLKKTKWDRTLKDWERQQGPEGRSRCPGVMLFLQARAEAWAPDRWGLPSPSNSGSGRTPKLQGCHLAADAERLPAVLDLAGHSAHGHGTTGDCRLWPPWSH